MSVSVQWTKIPQQGKTKRTVSAGFASTTVVTATTLVTSIAAGSPVGRLVDTDDTTIEPMHVNIVQIPATQIRDYNVLLVVQGLHRGIGILLGSKTDETESTAAEGVTVLDDNLQIVSKIM